MAEEEVEVVDRHELIFRIKVADAISLFDEVRENFQRLVENYGEQLTNLERNMFAVFYKKLLNKFRGEYDLYMNLQQQIPRREILKHRILRDNMYRARYEVINICKEVIDMIDNSILGTKNVELKIYFLKLRADHYRYWSITTSNDRFYGLHNRAEESYHLALELATKKLKRYHPLRLGIMLNMSIHYYRIPHDRIKAIQLSMQAVTEGKYHVDQHPDIGVAVRLLQDNLDIWMSSLGPREVHELEMLEGARKWHGKKAAVPSSHLLRHLSGEPIPKFEPPIVPRKRYFTMPQSLKHYCDYDDAPKYDAAVIYEQIFKPKIFPLNKTESTATESDTSTAKLEITQTESQINTSISTTTSPTPVAGTALQMTTANRDSIFVKAPERPPLTVLKEAHLPSYEEHALEEGHEHESDEEHVSHEEHASTPDPFEGILQPILLSSWSSSTQSSSDSLSQPPDDNGGDEHGAYQPSILDTTEPRDIPRTNEPLPTVIEDVSRLTRRLQSFESRMLAIQNRQLGLEQPEAGQESEGEDESNQPGEANDSAANEESQVSSNIVTSVSSSSILTSEASALSNTQTLSEEVGDSGQLQQQTRSVPNDGVADGDSRSETASKRPGSTTTTTTTTTTATTSHQIDFSAQQQQHRQESMETGQTKSSKTFGRLTLSEPKPPTPPPKSKAHERLIFPESKPPTPPPLVIFTPCGPKIVDFSPMPWLEGATASPSSVKKKVTFSDECTYWPSQSTRRGIYVRRPRQRSRQRQQLANRPPPPPLLLSPEQSPERGQAIPFSSGSTGDQQPVSVISQYDFHPQQSAVKQQVAAVARHRRKLAQRKLLRRSFSAPREGATWPISSLIREPPYFIYNALRQASAPSGRTFGRRFLSAHSSSEDLYDEAAEKVSPDPWAPRGTRTMRNTFPIIPWYPKEKPRVPWIPFQWPNRRTVNE